jgi:hypothetical protein
VARNPVRGGSELFSEYKSPIGGFRSARADDFPTLAESRAGGTEGDASDAAAQAGPPAGAKRVGGLPRACHQCRRPPDFRAMPIPQPCELLFEASLPREQIGEQERAQGFCSGAGEEGRESARASSGLAAGRVRRVPVIHRSERMQAFIECFEGPFEASRIAEKHDQKIDHLILSEPAARKAYLLADAFQNLLSMEAGAP